MDDSENPWGAMPCRPFCWESAVALDRKTLLHYDFGRGELSIAGAPLVILNQDHEGNDDDWLDSDIEHMG